MTEREEPAPGRTRTKRAEVLASVKKRTEWPRPDVECDDVPKDKHAQYFANKLAVDMWLEGKLAEEIVSKTGVKIRLARNMALKAVQLNRLARDIHGYWACIPGRRLGRSSWSRCAALDPAFAQDGKGLKGCLDDLLQKYPDIERRFVHFAKYRWAEGIAVVSLLTPKVLHRVFIDLCKQHGLEERGEWPFTSKRRGREAVRRWYHSERYKQTAQAVSNANGEAAGVQAAMDMKQLELSAVDSYFRAYERVELDEYYIDAIWDIAFPNADGTYQHIRTTRLWLLALVCSGSNAILAATLSFKRKYDRNDVMRLVRMALDPPPRIKLRYSNESYQYAAGASFASELEGLRGNTWQTLSLDRDASHVSDETLAAIENVVGCRVVSETLGVPRTRCDIEGLFRQLARDVEALPSATGNSPDSPVRRDPETAAKRYRLVVPMAEEIVDVWARNWNATPSAACQGVSPLQRLQELVNSGEVFRSPVGVFKRSALWRLLPVYEATLSRARGVGPLGVNLHGARYVSREMNADPELQYLSDSRVRVYVQEDARFAFVVPYACPEKLFSTVVTGRRFATMPHTLEWRQLATAAWKNGGVMGQADTPDVFIGVLRMLADAGKKDDIAAMFVGDATAFMSRYEQGRTSYVDVSADQREALLKQAHELSEEGDAVTADSTELSTNPFSRLRGK